MPAMSDAPPLLTSPEVGALINKSGRTVSRMAAEGTLTYSQKIPGPNGAYLFAQADVDAYIAATLTETAS